MERYASLVLTVASSLTRMSRVKGFGLSFSTLMQTCWCGGRSGAHISPQIYCPVIGDVNNVTLRPLPLALLPPASLRMQWLKDEDQSIGCWFGWVSPGAWLAQAWSAWQRQIVLAYRGVIKMGLLSRWKIKSAMPPQEANSNAFPLAVAKIFLRSAFRIPASTPNS